MGVDGGGGILVLGGEGLLGYRVGRGLDLGRGGGSGVVGRCLILSRGLDFLGGRGPSWWDHAPGQSGRYVVLVYVYFFLRILIFHQKYALFHCKHPAPGPEI